MHRIRTSLIIFSYSLALYESAILRILGKFKLFHVSSHGLFILDFCLTFLIVAINVYLLFSSVKVKVHGHIFLCLILFLIFSFLSVFWSAFPKASIVSFMKLLAGTSFLFVFYNELQSKEDVYPFIFILIAIPAIGVMLDFVYSLYSLLSNSVRFHPVCRRVFSAHTCIISSFVLSVFFLVKDISFDKKLGILVASIMIFCFFGARSKTGMLSTFIFYPFLYEILIRKSYKRLLPYLVLLFLFIVSIIVVEPVGSLFKVFHGKFVTLQYRFDIWRACLRIIRENPVVGTGIGTFKHVMENPGILREIHYAQHAHNYFIHLALEVGLLGLLLWVNYVFFFLKGVLRQFKELRENNIYVVFLFAIGISLIYQLGDSSLQELYFQSIFYSISGLLLAYIED